MDLAVIIAATNLIVNVLVVGFWKPWLGAYGGEKGKNLARREDIDKIVDEIAKVTRTQEEIKTELAGDLWLRQTIRTERKAVYAEVLSTIHNATDACNELWQIRKHIVRSEFVENADIDPVIRRHMQAFHDAETELIRLTALVMLFASPSATEILKEYLKKPKAVDFVHAPDETRVRRDELIELNEALVAAAQTDLGLVPT